MIRGKTRQASAALSLALFSFQTVKPFNTWHRATNAPILSPQGDAWESAGTFNPAVIIHQGRVAAAGDLAELKKSVGGDARNLEDLFIKITAA